MSDTTSAAARPERKPARPTERRNAFQRLALWYRQIVAELRKVIWPTRKELVSYTLVTLIFAVTIIIFIFLIDYGANWAVLKIWS